MPMPTKPESAKAVRVSITLPPSTLTKIKSMLQPGESLSALIGKLIEVGLNK